MVEIQQKRIAFIAHDGAKKQIAEWAVMHKSRLQNHELFSTGMTGALLKEKTGLDITLVKSGPLGGDLQIGAMIAEKKLDILIFFIDPMTRQSHDEDVKPLLRIAVLNQVAFACNTRTADYIIYSELMD